MPQKISPEQYRQSRANGWTDEDLLAKGYEIPRGAALPAAAPRDAVRDIADPNANGGGLAPVAGMVRTAAQNIPLVGPYADEIEGMVRGDGGAGARKSVSDFRNRMGGVGAIAELGAGLAMGNAAFKGAGAIGKMALGGDVVTPASGLANFALRNAARVGSGAATGAIMGAGAANPGSRMKGAIGGGAMGGIVGAVPAVVEGMQGAKRLVDRTVSHWGADNHAAAQLGKELRSDRLIRTADRPAAFAGETLADAVANHPSDYTSGVLRDAIHESSTQGGDLKIAMSDRAGGRAGRIGDAMATGTGVGDRINPRQLMQDLREGHKPAVSSAYATAEAEGAVLDDKALKKALGDTPMAREARRVARLRMANRKQELPTVQVAGKSDPIKVPNLTLVDYAKRHLDTKIRGLLKQSDLGKAAEAMEIRNRIINEADRLAPSYAEARLVAQEQQSLKEAVRLGQALGKTPGTDVRDATSALEKLLPAGSAQEVHDQIREAFRKGVASSLQARLAKSKSGQQALTDLLGHENARDVARLAFPDDQTFQKFERALSAELQQLPGEALVQGARINPEFLATDALHGISPWSLSKTLAGNPSLLAAQTVSVMSGAAKRKSAIEAAKKLTEFAATPMGSPKMEAIAKAARQQLRNPLLEGVQAMRQRRTAAKVNPMLERLFQTFVTRAYNNGNAQQDQ